MRTYRHMCTYELGYLEMLVPYKTFEPSKNGRDLSKAIIKYIWHVY